MQFLGLLLDAENAIGPALGMILAFLLVLAAIAWASVRFLKQRLGWIAYVLAGLIFLLPVIWLLSGLAPRGAPNSGPPKVLTSPKLSLFLRGGGDPGIAGLAFFDGALYVGTGMGLVEVRDGKVSKLLRFQNSISVVSGPWLDPANHLLWAVDDNTMELVRFDGKRWARTPEPVSPDSCRALGFDEGTHLIGGTQGFWLVSSGCAWRWDAPSRQWRLAATVPPPAGYPSGSAFVFGVLPMEPAPLLIIRHDLRAWKARPDETFASDEIAADAAVNSPAIERQGEPFRAGTWAVTADAAYICTKDQTLLQVTTQLVSAVPSPGPCEALAGGADADLLVGIRRQGIFRYSPKNGWTLIANAPYPSGEGDYSAFLAAANGQVAFAMERKPILSEGNNVRFNAPTALWTLRGRDFVPVPLR